MVMTVPSNSVRLTRRPPCSQLRSLPWRSTVLPLVWPAGWRKTPTVPLDSSQRSWRSFGISLQTSERQPGDQAGPSAQAQPSKSLWTRAVALMHLLNLGSRNANSSTAIPSPFTLAVSFARATVARVIGQCAVAQERGPEGARSDAGPSASLETSDLVTLNAHLNARRSRGSGWCLGDAGGRPRGHFRRDAGENRQQWQRGLAMRTSASSGACFRIDMPRSPS